MSFLKRLFGGGGGDAGEPKSARAPAKQIKAQGIH